MSSLSFFEVRRKEIIRVAIPLVKTEPLTASQTRTEAPVTNPVWDLTARFTETDMCVVQRGGLVLGRYHLMAALSR